MDEVVAFLRAHPPFDALPEPELGRLAAAAERTAFADGETIFAQRAAPRRAAWIVRSGAVELLDGGRVLDLLGPGELFGHPSMLAELPTGLEARARGATACYRLPGEVARPLLARPEGMRHVARTLLARPGAGRVRDEDGWAPERPVGALLRAAPVVCAPDAPIREAARRMTEAGQRCVVVRLPDGLGILTDGDLRSRVVAAGVSADAPVAAAMTAPAHTVGEDRLGAEALVEMLDRAVRHLPVLAADGRLLGVVDDADLLAAERRTPFRLRTAIAAAAGADELAVAAADLWPTVAALHDARVTPEHVGAIVSVVADALTRRLLDIAVDAAGPPPAPFAWLALGSLARREGVPSSDVDCAIAWDGDDEDPAVRAYVQGVARAVLQGLERCGLPADLNGATADRALFARSVGAWGAALESWFEEPTQDRALILVSLVGDGRAVWGADHAAPLAAGIAQARRHPGLLRLLARLALAHRPPTGFWRDLVVEHTGEHKGRLDLKHGGLIPIVDLARWAGLTAGAPDSATPARLRAARAAGVLSDDDGRMLGEAFTLVSALRLEHQVQQVRAGERPDDHLRPETLSPLTRSYLKDAFRAVAAVQRRIGTELTYGVV